MTLVVYTVPLVSSAENNSSSTAKTSIIVKSCDGFSNPNQDCDGWNFNHCPNDKSYHQPFIQGDLIYGQIKYDKNKYTRGAFDVINIDTGLGFINGSFLTQEDAIDRINNKYYNFILNTGSSLFNNITCFYTQLTLVGIGENPTIQVFSEPYRVVRCDEKTLLITGDYPSGYDCFGGYYGVVNTDSESAFDSIYKASLRTYGVVEPDNFDFEKTENNNITIKSKQFLRFLFRIQPVPYYVAKQIAVCFNSKKVTIDGEIYKGTVKLQKNNEEGSMWISNETIFQECNEINFTCD